MTDGRPAAGIPHIAGLLPESIAAYLSTHGVEVRPGEARRLLAHAISPTASKDRKRHPLSARLQAQAHRLLARQPLEVLERVEDPTDGFTKFLFRHPDGALSEAVRIPLHKAGTYSVCLSTQVGCAMACAFCATGRLGLTRNLEAWEIVSASIAVRDETAGRVSRAVFMGQGEPLANYDNVIRAARILSHSCGGRIRGDGITISTIGLPSHLRRFVRDRLPFQLFVSLTSAIESRRAALLPMAGENSVAKISAILHDYAETCRGRITLAWVMLAGINTGDDEVAALQKHFGDLPLRISLIDYNDTGEQGFASPGDIERNHFIDGLKHLGVPIVRRYSGGAACRGACGTLVARRFAANVAREAGTEFGGR